MSGAQYDLDRVVPSGRKDSTQEAIEFIRNIEKELHLLIEKEAKGIATEHDKKRSRSIETVIIYFNATNY